MNCYCGRDQKFSNCCEIYIKGQAAPSTCEDLMRSRYSVFCTVNMDYLQQTTDLQARYDFDHGANEAWAQSAKFSGLEIVQTEDHGNKGIVEFKARFHLQNEDHVHHEISTFRKTGGVWYYRSGRVIPAPPVKAV